MNTLKDKKLDAGKLNGRNKKIAAKDYEFAFHFLQIKIIAVGHKTRLRFIILLLIIFVMLVILSCYHFISGIEIYLEVKKIIGKVVDFCAFSNKEWFLIAFFLGTSLSFIAGRIFTRRPNSKNPATFYTSILTEEFKKSKLI